MSADDQDDSEEVPVHQRIAEELRNGLMCGEYPPGAVLTLRPLAARFNVSPMPVREALRQLVAERALVVEPNGSVAVPTLDVEHLIDIRNNRIVLEGLAAELAATRVTKDQLDALDSLVRGSEAADHSGNGGPNLERNRQFHFIVYAASGSKVMLPLIESLWLQFGPYLQVVIQHVGSSMGAGEEFHRQVVDALRAGDPVAARQAVERDIGRAMDIMLDIYASDTKDAHSVGGRND